MKGRDAAYRIAPFALFIAFLAAGAFVASPWLPVARGVAVALLLAAFWPHYTELHPQNGVRVLFESKSTLTPFLLAVASGLLVFAVWITLDSGWMLAGEIGKGFAPLTPDGAIDWWMAGLRLAGLALVVPVMEELFWRSFLMRWIDKRDFLSLDPKRASLAAFAISSALFAIEHTQWLAGLIAGVVYAGLYKKTGNLRVPIISHGVTNGTLGIWILATGNWQYW